MLTGSRPRALALLGDLAILIAFPFIGAMDHENAVTFESFTRTVVPFAFAWVVVGVGSGALALATLRSVRRTAMRVPPAWLAAGVLAIGLRVTVFDRDFSLAFSLVAIGLVGALIIGWRLLLAAVLRTR
jgi:hypothetical protein